jgi:hypothetical protein
LGTATLLGFGITEEDGYAALIYQVFLGCYCVVLGLNNDDPLSESFIRHAGWITSNLIAVALSHFLKAQQQMLLLLLLPSSSSRQLWGHLTSSSIVDQSRQE